MNKLVVFILLVFGSGCTLIPQKVNLNPSLMLEQENIGHGTQVFLTVQDNRTDHDIGYRNSIIHSGPMSLNGDMGSIFYGQMKKILEAKGFIIVDNSALGKVCDVKIKDFK